MRMLKVWCLCFEGLYEQELVELEIAKGYRGSDSLRYFKELNTLLNKINYLTKARNHENLGLFLHIEKYNWFQCSYKPSLYLKVLY